MHIQAEEVIQKTAVDPVHNSIKVDERKEGRLPTNIFRSILYSSLPSAEKRRDRMAQEGFVIIAAGGETTGRVLTTATFHLLANRTTALLRLQQELAEVMEDPSYRPDLRTLEQLPWLVSCL